MNKLSEMEEKFGFEIREHPETISHIKPFVTTEHGPLWFQTLPLKELELQGQYGDLARRELVNIMVWSRAISLQQTPQTFKNLNATSDGLPRANMIGLYDQMFNTTPVGAFAKIPDGDFGSVFLLRSGDLFSVFADSVGAAKRFCLNVIESTNLKASVASDGIGLEIYNDIVRQLTP